MLCLRLKCTLSGRKELTNTAVGEYIFNVHNPDLPAKYQSKDSYSWNPVL